MMMTLAQVSTATLDQLTDELAAAGWDSTQASIEDAREAVSRLIEEFSKTMQKINRVTLEAAVIEYLELVDSTQHHIHLRINSKGEAYVSEDTSYCVSFDEYNREPGHTRTVKHQRGHGQCALAEDWTDYDDGMDEIASTIDMILEDMDRQGVKVEWVAE